MADSETNLPAPENEEEEKDDYIVAGKKSLQELLDQDKGDESLEKYKKSLIKSTENVAKYPDDPRQVIVDSFSILVEGRDPIKMDIYDKELPNKPYILKEGTPFKIQIVFFVQHEIVLGLKWVNKVHKLKIQVDRTNEMIGSFPPQQDPHTHSIPEDIAPHGILARGHYTATGQLVDDDKKVHAQWKYSFDIREHWP